VAKRLSLLRLQVLSSHWWFMLIVIVVVPATLIFAFTGCDAGDDDQDDADGDNNDPTDDDDTTGDDDDDDDNDNDDNDDDTPPIEYPPLIAGPNDVGYDAELEALARKYDRSHLLFNCAGHGINADVSVNLEDEEDRELIESFIRETDSWDFEAYSGKTVEEVVDTFHKVAGLYGGVGIAADAFRYGVMRDQGYEQEEVDRAREFLRRDIDALFVACEITGVTGVLPRGICRIDTPGYCADLVTTPLFDDDGNPLPEEKNNGTWRADNSEGGQFPDYKWEDSCSRDMYLGWATAFGAIWEVIKDDVTFDQEIKATLQQYASDAGRNLMVLRPAPPWGEFDLEIYDSDGRPTFHAYLNENAYDRIYLPFIPIKDGIFAMMAVGIVSSLTYASEDPVLIDYLYDHLFAERGLDRIIQNNQLGVNLGWITNYSSTNMAFEGALMAQRYVASFVARDRIRWSTVQHLYEEGKFSPRRPEAFSYSLYDFVYSSAVSGGNAFGPTYNPPDYEAIERGIQTLKAFPEPPFWDFGVENCDADEIESGVCELNDGTMVTVLGNVGRNNDLITKEPIPQGVRPPSNYRWRSNPYQPNVDGSGSTMLPGVDFRWAYWYGRWAH
jgi:hypothetical protein